jgi:hypothetical protein
MAFAIIFDAIIFDIDIISFSFDIISFAISAMIEY